MEAIFEKIQELEEVPSYSKHERFVEGIVNAINEKLIGVGDPLPSVNAMISGLGYARETVMKGYRELQSRGLIESKNRLGYFVSDDNTRQSLKVALLMYTIDTFQEQFYRSFRNELGPDVHLDVFFHHGNIEVFETMFSLVKNRHYGMYVISPIHHPRTRQLLQTIPQQKLLMFDRYEPLEGAFNYVVQEFEKSSYAVFEQLAGVIKQFDKMMFFHNPDSLFPPEIVRSFKRFIQKHKIKGEVLREYEPGSVEKGVVYYVNENAELWNLLRDCIAQKIKPGKDIGILSHNDEPVKELVGNGITTYSVSFSEMGKRAAQAVLRREPVQEVLPTRLIRRNSL
ncbi:GntR family transcriptional regulator [Chitinophaga pendula]|uniref:GntR family transcriptional regulator n=1 Tax=Chitinophaga TaxID=79328 RepID=UPI000BAFE822|nr:MULTISPECIES: GntR family transcriptional regulator [Chitinophaga]ASZ13252.1 GntR family transcriptional regulator [Chitinophaga sp. MD30]UCJ09127.1 GntR family transcriptional regulator [Chitinophaga pendula]